MSGDCCVNPGAKQTYETKGFVEKIADIPTYKIGDGKNAIVIFTDIFGFDFINIRKIADHYSQATGGFTVYIPDQMKGDAMDPTDKNLIDKLPSWLAKHPVDEACKLADKFIAAIHAKHPSSIQVIGFCYGAKPVLHLITQDQPSVKAAAVAHPSFLALTDDVQLVKRPILFQCAEHDQRFPPDLRQHYEQGLKTSGLGQFIDYPGTVHGFVTRPDGTKQVEEQKEKALSDAIDYFKKHA